jgi:hypothetical protein
MRHPYRRSRLPRLLAPTSRPRCSHSRMKSSSNPLLRLLVINGPAAFEIRLPFYPRSGHSESIIYVNDSFAPEPVIQVSGLTWCRRVAA